MGDRNPFKTRKKEEQLKKVRKKKGGEGRKIENDQEFR